MSVVAVRVTEDKIVIGADSIRVCGYTQEKDAFAKLEKVNDMIIGSVGSCEEKVLFYEYCKTRKPKTATESVVS